MLRPLLENPARKVTLLSAVTPERNKVGARGMVLPTLPYLAKLDAP
jgi:hypothetical protein